MDIREEFIKHINDNCVEFSANERGGYIDDTFNSVFECVELLIKKDIAQDINPLLKRTIYFANLINLFRI